MLYRNCRLVTSSKQFDTLPEVIAEMKRFIGETGLAYSAISQVDAFARQHFHTDEAEKLSDGKSKIYRFHMEIPIMESTIVIAVDSKCKYTFHAFAAVFIG